MVDDTRRTVLVTGGGTGIGRAVSERFERDGFRVVAMGRDRDPDLPEGIEFVEADVVEETAVRGVVAGIDRIDALVNCAGILRQEREWQAADFRTVLDVNLTGTHIVAMAALDKLAASQGCVVNVASMWSFFGSPKSPAYAASKGGVVALTRSMAVAWGPKGIRVNAVAPGWVSTRMAIGARDDPERGPRITARIPLGRWAEPRDVADVIAFLTSDQARYVHGVVLPVDGGYSIG